MTLFINGVSVPFTLEKEKQAGEVVSGIRTWLEGQKWTLTGVLLNGNPYQDSGDLPNLPVGQIESLEIAANDLGGHAPEADPTPEKGFQEALSRLGDFLPRIGDISLKIQMGQDKQAMDLILELLNVLDDLTTCWNLLSRTSDGLSRWNPSHEMDLRFRELNRFLKEVAAAFEAKDFILVGDLIEYEISPRLAAFIENTVE